MERQQIDTLKARVSLVGYLEGQGHELKKNGAGLVTGCPFHADDTPSLSVDPERGLYNCFGCGKSGDILSWLQEAEQLSFPEALERLQELAGGVMDNSSPAVVPGNGRSSGPLRGDLFERVADLYAAALAQSAEARQYLVGRGITNLEVLRTLRVGYSQGRELSRVAGSDELKEALRAQGLVNERGWDFFTGCVVVPLRDRDRRVTGFLGRRIRSSENPHRTLSGPRRGLFFPEAARGTASVLLVEGFLDALACYQAGFRHVMALGGRVLTDEVLRHLVREKVQEVLLCLDADEAGDRGACEAAERLAREKIRARRVELPVKDPTEFFLTRAHVDFRKLLQEAPLLGAGPQQATLVTEDDWLELMLTEGAFLYRARLLTAPSTGKLRALVRLEGPRGRSHRDSLDLYSHKARKVFSNRASERFEGLTPGGVESVLERLIDQAEAASRSSVPEEPVDTSMSDEEQEATLAFLRRPDLVEAILSDIDQLGHVGEETAKLLVYLIATSRLLEKPLSGILRSESAAGKSFVAELAEQLTPPEGVVLYSRISALALAYSPGDSLKHRLLILEERAGGEAADYTIRTLQSKKRLTQKVTIKDPSTGQPVAKEYTVEGPIAYLETTTDHQLNPENTSRCFEITLDESIEQTRRIHERQRRARSLELLDQKERAEAVCRRHHNLQRLLEPVRVVIPYAGELTFPDHYLRTRRDHERFLSLIEVVAFLHQHQRPRRIERGIAYIEATLDDYRIAYELAQRVLRVSLDELTRWSRELYEALEQQAREAEALEGVPTESLCWTRRQVRETTRWPDRRLRECLKELVDMEYLEVVKGGSQGRTYVYRLAIHPGVSRAVLGLLTPEELAGCCARFTGSRPAGERSLP